MSEEVKRFTGPELKIGMTAERTKTITREDIDSFGKVSTDMNPMHFDEAYAAKTQFGRCIAHGLISLGLCSALLGMQLPGLGTVYLGQEVRFQKPVYPGDTVTAHCEVTDIQYKEKKDFYIVKLRTWATNQRGETVTDGVATCIPPK